MARPVVPVLSPLHPPPAWAADYVGLPWRSKGRARDGLDCWGLVRLVELERFGVELPLLDEVGWESGDHKLTAEAEHKRRLIAMIAAEEARRWREVTPAEAQPGDVVTFTVLGEPLHVGVVVSPGWMLHIRAGAGSLCQEYDGLAWRKKLETVHRFKRPSRSTAQ